MFLIFLLFFVFIFSLFLGSFINVVVDRVYRGEQFVKGHSCCESCKHTLFARDLVPIISFLSLKGKCRYCKKKFSPFYVVSELVTAVSLTAVVYLLISIATTWSLSMFFVSVLCVSLTFILLLIFLTDLKYFVIPDIYLYLLLSIYIAFGGLYLLHTSTFFLLPLPFNIFIARFLIPFKGHILSSILMGLFFAVLHFGTKKKAMGEGDIYLSAILALYLGPVMSVVMWFISFFSGAIIGILLIILGKRKMKSAVPFGPFLIFGFVVALMFGKNIVDYYFSLIF